MRRGWDGVKGRSWGEGVGGVWVGLGVGWGSFDIFKVLYSFSLF